MVNHFIFRYRIISIVNHLTLSEIYINYPLFSYTFIQATKIFNESLTIASRGPQKVEPTTEVVDIIRTSKDSSADHYMTDKKKKVACMF